MKTISAALSRISTGGTIVLRRGSYHENVTVPAQKRVTIQPAPYEEVWLDGAETVTGWRASGSTWIKDGWTLDLDDSPTYRRGAPDNTKPGWRFVPADRPMAAHPDQVWVGGSPLQQVSSRELVTRGTFFVDKTSRQLVIGSSPDGVSVQASVLTQALSIRSNGSIVRGIGIRRYATSMPDMGTVVAAADDVSLVDVMIRDNSTTGFYSWGRSTTLTRVSLIANGVLGGGASTADGLSVSQLLSAGNNVEGFNRAPVSGAFKVTRTRRLTITDSAFLDNAGQGPWIDESVYDITFTGNDVIGNHGNGLVVELSEKAIIADNVIANNGIAGIFVVNSGSVDIWNNTVVGNQRNINIVMDARRASDTGAPGHDPRRPKPDPTVPWITRNVVVSDNVIGAAEGDCVICVEDSSRSTRGVQMVTSSNGNLYHRSTASAPRWFGIWANGAEGSRTYDTLAQFRSATGYDGRSVLAVGASVVSETFALVPARAEEQASIAVPIPVNVAAVSRLQGGSRVLGAVPR